MDKPSFNRLPPLAGLRAFEAAARHLSFTRAADELAVTQAAVSHQIRSLEEWLGRPLFRRRNRRVLLTEDGQHYYLGVRDGLERLAQATQKLQQIPQDTVLTVSTLASFAANWLVPRLGSFRAEAPEIDVRISASDAKVDFHRDNVDLAIRYGPGGWPGVEQIKLMTEDYFPVCSPSLLEGPHPLRKPEDLSYHTLLHDDMREDWTMWLMAAGVDSVDPSHGATFNLSSLVLQAAVDGQGVALGRSALVSRDLATGRLVRPFDVTLPGRYGYYIVYLTEALDKPAVRQFINWACRNVAEESQPVAPQL